MLDQLGDDLVAAGHSVFDAVAYDIGLGMVPSEFEGGGAGYFAYDFTGYSSSQLELTNVTVIPEPSTFVLAALAMLVLSGTRRRRSSQ